MRIEFALNKIFLPKKNFEPSHGKMWLRGECGQQWPRSDFADVILKYKCTVLIFFSNKQGFDFPCKLPRKEIEFLRNSKVYLLKKKRKSNIINVSSAESSQRVVEKSNAKWAVSIARWENLIQFRLVSTYGPQRRKMYLLTCALNADFNQPAHLRIKSDSSLAAWRNFVSLATQNWAQRSFWSDYANAQSDQNLRWAHMSVFRRCDSNDE